MDGAPRVTLGVPLNNAERYLEGCLDALLAQDYPDFEIVICDNASTDRTWEICQRYAAANARIRLYRNPRNFGGPYNHARVVELARGELFKWAAYDDICLPSHVSTCVAALDAAGPQAVLAYPRTVLIGEAGEVIGPYHDGLDLRDPRPWRRVAGVAQNVSLCHAHFGVFRISALRRTGLIRPFLASDYTLLAEVAQLGEIHEVDQPLFLRRLHSASTRQAKDSTPATAIAWFAPESRGKRVRTHRLRMLTATAIMLATGDARLRTRLSSAVAFLTTWYVRRVRVLGGRWRRRLARRLIRRSASAPAKGSV